LHPRGYLALAIICLALLLCDPIQRFVIAPTVRLAPARRVPLLTRWQRLMAQVVLKPLTWVGGASMPPLPRIEAGPGTLLLMNHQSVLDIPLMVGTLHGTYPRIVTRRRYLRWIPLISHMVRLYQYPIVDPGASPEELQKMVDSLADAARNADVPLAIFPEGTRTKDGRIGRFRSRGLEQVLRERPWTVYVLVGDGFWRHARMKDLLADMRAIKGRMEVVGPFAWHPSGDPSAFAEQLRGHMVACLERMRSPGALA